MALVDIEQLLKQHMGLHSSTVGSGTVLHAVEQRMRECRIGDIDDYHQVLLHSDTELDALVDTVVIPETWFYRDIKPFEMLDTWLREEWLPRHSNRVLRLLSVPCSSGEEAYTLAMCLADAGIGPQRARIDAIDISSTNIDKALTGAYGRNSFRGQHLGYRDRHFQADGARYRINDDIRQYVHFEQANMLDADFGRDREPYHVIFCRNLLIYFDRATQDRAIDRLQDLLDSDGLLFLGHSETGLMLNRDFSALPGQRCFGFRRGKPEQAGHEDGSPRQPEPRHHPPRRRLSNETTNIPRPFSDVVKSVPETPCEPLPKPENDRLGEAFRLADEGHLDEAAALCEAIIEEHRDQAEAYFLLGLVRESAGNLDEAERLLRKAVYLEPAHHQALVHLGVVCEQRGDSANASRFRERARRAAARIPDGAVP